MVRKSNVERYREHFRKLCEEVANEKRRVKSSDRKEGKWYQKEVLKTPITEENFKMAYAELDENDPFYLCRRQLPPFWFVSKYGEVIEFPGDPRNYSPRWKSNNRKNAKRRYEKQYVIETSYILEKQYRLKYSDRKVITNHALASIVYEGRIFGKAEESIRKWGIEAFGSKGTEDIPREEMVTSHHTRGYWNDNNEEHTYEENMAYNNDPNYMMLVTNRVHGCFKDLIRTTEDPDDFARLSKVCKEILEEECPGKFFVIIPYPRDKEGHHLTAEELKNYNIKIGTDKTGREDRIQLLASNIPYVDILAYDMSEKDKLKDLGIIDITDIYGEIVNYIPYFDVPLSGDTFRFTFMSGDFETFYDWYRKIHSHDNINKKRPEILLLDSALDKYKERLLNGERVVLDKLYKKDVTFSIERIEP